MPEKTFENAMREVMGEIEKGFAVPPYVKPLEGQEFEQPSADYSSMYVGHVKWPPEKVELDGACSR